MPSINLNLPRGKRAIFCLLILPLLFSFLGEREQRIPVGSTYSPTVLIDSSSRAIWAIMIKSIRGHKKTMKKRMRAIRETVDMNLRQGLPEDNLLLNELSYLTNGLWRINATLANLRKLKRSKIKYAVVLMPKTDKSGNVGKGGTYYNTILKTIVFMVGDTANFIHETTHGSQLEQGRIAFNKNTGGSFGDDSVDEIEAYQMQFAFDPRSIEGLSFKDPKVFSRITDEWLKGMVIDGDHPYAEGGSAQLALIPITIWSPRDSILKGYSYLLTRNSLWPVGYQVTTDSNMYYKHQKRK
jgi:hypothetical protein